MNYLLTILLSFVLAHSAFATEKTKIPTYTEDQLSISVKTEQPAFIIQLKSNPSTGYSWFLKKQDLRYFEPALHQFQAPENKHLIGASGYERWTFKTKPTAFARPHQTTLHFVYARPWEKNKKNIEVIFAVSISHSQKQK